MPKERVFLVDVDVVSRKGKTALRLFLKREKDGKAFAAYDYDFKPYFYLLPDEKTVGEKGSKKREQFVDSVTASSFEFNKHLARVLKVEGVERFLNAEKIEVLKVVCSHPFVVPHVRERLKQFGQTFEYAIAFHFRYVIDKKIVPNSLVELEYEGSLKSAQVKSVKAVDSDKRPAYRVVAFDIETFNSGAAMHPEKDPCIMISACSPKECRVFTYSKKIPLKFVDVRKGEGEMIDAFCDFVRENRADFLCSYNGDAFDLPYLKTRAKKTRAVFRLGRDKSQVSVKKFGAMSKSKVGGRVHFDVYRAVSFLNIVGSVKLQRLTLKSVYAEILGGKKLDFSHEDVWRAWESGKNLEELAQYSKVDAQACFDLAKYALPNAIEMSRVSGMPVFDSSHASTGQLVEFLLMRESFDSNQLVPPKPQYAKVSARTANPIKGAFVKMPEPGIYENIAVMDFKSLYPSIIVSYNIDPSTLDCECCKTGFESPLGQRFCSKRKGLIPHALEKILDARNIAKKEMKKFDSKSEDYRILDARQWSLKVLANSVGPGEPVILLDPSNMLRIVPIGEFVDSAASFRLVEKSEVGFKKGWKAACFIGNRIQFKPVQAVIRHKCSGNVFKIQLKSGRSVVVTKDHSLFTLNDKGCVAPVKGLEVKKGSFLIVPKKFPALNEKTTLEFSIMHSLAAAPVEELRDIIVTAKLPHPKDVLANFEKILDCLKKPLFIGLICKRTGLSRSAVSKLLRKMEKEGFVRIVRVRNR
ncbi:MAG: 3'-5' exonuclease, partial [Candidatus Micrarchaeia archaeon]